MQSEMIINRNFITGEVDDRLFGGFIEHMGRAVYNGIYEPDHPLADRDGFREDVLELVRELDMAVTRYPGGNFVSNYNWKDGIGPRENRPVKLDYEWQSLEPNIIGIDEFMKWCCKANTEPFYAVNISTNTPKSAQELVEYCNFPKGSYWSDLRRKNGAEEPYNIKYWSLGNEVDGEWQAGHMTAQEYGRVAHETAKMMKKADPSISLCACGSCGIFMPTFGKWDYEILEHVYNDVDFISVHAYFNNRAQDMPNFLASAEKLDYLLDGVIACCDAVKAQKKSDKTMFLALDEWNVWYRGIKNSANSEKWQCGQPFNEEIYDMSDVLVNGCALISMLEHADRVKMGCIAQTVNIIAPIMTVTGGKVWKQTIYHPLAACSKYGRGTVLKSVIDSPSYETDFGFKVNAKYLRACAVYNQEKHEITVFAVNRSEEEMDFELRMENFEAENIISATEIHHDDLNAKNSAEKELVFPQDISPEKYNIKNNILKAKLKPYSWNMFRIKEVQK